MATRFVHVKDASVHSVNKNKNNWAVYEKAWLHRGQLVTVSCFWSSWKIDDSFDKNCWWFEIAFFRLAWELFRGHSRLSNIWTRHFLSFFLVNAMFFVKIYFWCSHKLHLLVQLKFVSWFPDICPKSLSMIFLPFFPISYWIWWSREMSISFFALVNSSYS